MTIAQWRRVDWSLLHLVVVTSTGGKAGFTVINRQIVVTSAAAVAKPPA